MAFAGRLIRQSLKTLKPDFIGRPTVWRWTPIRCASTEDFEPCPAPTTPAEKAVIARKHNMTVSEYEPYAEDGFGGWADYPKLKPIQEEDKDPWGDWDMRDERRNWGEPLHIDADWLVRFKARIHERGDEALSWKEKRNIFFGVMGVIAVLAYIGQYIKYFPPVAPKQFPYNDLWIEKGGEPEDMPVKKYFEF